MAALASIVSITGNGTVYAVNAQGVQRVLKDGDSLEKGETIRTVGNANVELMMDDGRMLHVNPDQVVKLDDNVFKTEQTPTAADAALTTPVTADTVIQALDRGQDLSTTLDSTAAGLGDGGGGGGATFVQLGRISEGITGNSYGFDFSGQGIPAVEVGVGQLVTATNVVGNLTATITVNPVAGDGIINRNENTTTTAVSGTVGGDVKAGDLVTVKVDGHEYTTKVVDDGTGKLVYSVEVTVLDIADAAAHATTGKADIQVSVTTYSADGSASASTSADVLVVFDLVGPSPALGLMHDTGSNGLDLITKDGHLNISAVEPNTTRVITVDGKVVTAYDASLLEDGKHTVSITDTDVAGNSKTSDLTFTLDTTIAAPTIALSNDSAPAVDGEQTTNIDKVTNDATLAISEPAKDVTRVITVDGVTVDAYDPKSLEDGKHTVTITDTDVAGNTKSTDFAFTLDTTIATPTIALNNDSAPAVDDVSTNTDLVTNDPTLLFSKPADDVTREYSTDGGQTWTKDYTAPTVDGEYTVTVRDTDVAGNQATSDTLSFTLDTTIATPTIALNNDSAPAVDDVSTNTDLVTNDPTLLFSKPADDVTREYSTDGGHTWTKDYTAPTVDGEYTVTVRDTDVAGNQATSDTLSFTLDTTIATPTIALNNDSAPAVDDVSTNTDLVTNDPTLLFSKPADDVTREYSTDGGHTWTKDYTAPTVDGEYTVTVRDTDVAGNQATSDTLSFTLDTTIATPTIALNNDSAPAVDDVSTNTDLVTNDPTLLFSKPADDVTREYSTDGGHTWTKDYTAPTVDGEYTVTVRDTDVAGNQATSDTLSFTLDTTIATPTIALDPSGVNELDTDGKNESSNGQLVFGEPAENVTREYRMDGETNWSSSYTPPANDGEYTVTVRDTDVAGNVATKAFTFTVETNDHPTVTVQTGNDDNKNDVVSESGLSTGTHPDHAAAQTEGTFTVSDPEGLGEIQYVSIAGQQFTLTDLEGATSKDPITFNDLNGTLCIVGCADGVVHYTYTLETALSVEGEGNNVAKSAISYDITVEDVHGGVANATINIDVRDDAPVIQVTNATLRQSGDDHEAQDKLHKAEDDKSAHERDDGERVREAKQKYDDAVESKSKHEGDDKDNERSASDDKKSSGSKSDDSKNVEDARDAYEKAVNDQRAHHENDDKLVAKYTDDLEHTHAFTTATASGTLAVLGADGGHIDWTTLAAPAGLTSHGDAVTYSIDENVLTASTGDSVVFTLTADENGNYVFTQTAQIDIGGHEDESASKSLVFGFTATDGDGDQVASTSANNLTITLYKSEDIEVTHNQSHEMSGHEGSDTFKWSLSDHNDETVKNFDFKHEGGKGGDVLDVRDLLSGAHSDAKHGEAGSLDQFLKFSVEGEGDNKHLELLVKHDGGMDDKGHNADQKIVLDGYSSKEALAHDIGSSSTSDMDMLKKLVETGHLKTDHS